MTFFHGFVRSSALVWVALAANLFLPGLGLSQSLDELHKLALKEGGTLNFYATLAQINAEKILPVFEKRFPGIKINHVDATSDKLVARAVTEARVPADVGPVHREVRIVELAVLELGDRADRALEAGVIESEAAAERAAQPCCASWRAEAGPQRIEGCPSSGGAAAAD